MMVLFIFSLVVAAVLWGATGLWAVGAIAGGLVFICGLPAALLVGFVHGEVSYAQDRADWRAEKSDMAADLRETDRAYSETERLDRLLERVDQESGDTIINDNRQIHFHGGVR